MQVALPRGPYSVDDWQATYGPVNDVREYAKSMKFLFENMLVSLTGLHSKFQNENGGTQTIHPFIYTVELKSLEMKMDILKGSCADVDEVLKALSDVQGRGLHETEDTLWRFALASQILFSDLYRRIVEVVDRVVLNRENADEAPFHEIWPVVVYCITEIEHFQRDDAYLAAF